MAKRAAIRLEGQGAEELFLKLVPGARVSDKAKLGDAIVSVDGVDAYVEIKECHAPPNKGGTINQVRAIKYICCVVWAPERACWYVVSPDQLVQLAATKNRGQHTDIPFECMNFTLASLPGRFHTRCDDKHLAEAVFAAIRRGRKRTDLAKAMQALLAEIEAIKRRYIELVSKPS